MLLPFMIYVYVYLKKGLPPLRNQPYFLAMQNVLPDINERIQTIFKKLIDLRGLLKI